MKNFIKLASPDLYDRLVRLRSGPAMRLVSGTPNRFRVTKHLRAGNAFAMDVCGSMGFGATLTHAVRLHSYFDAQGTEISIRASNPLYTTPEQPDMLGTFFRRLGSAPAGQDVVPFHFDQDVTLAPLAADLTIAQANAIFSRHYALRDEDLAEVRGFLASIGSPCIGVHFRGSDKRLEVARVDWEVIAQATKITLAHYGLWHVLVATDEAPFIDFMRDRFGQDRVFNYKCHHLAQGTIPAHFTGGDPVEKGREALLTILLLSMCQACVRGNSYLSAWAKIFNPSLAVVALNQPYGDSVPFPETEIYVDYCRSDLSGRVRTAIDPVGGLH